MKMQIGNSLVAWAIRHDLIIDVRPAKERGQAHLPDLETIGLARLL